MYVIVTLPSLCGIGAWCKASVRALWGVGEFDVGDLPQGVGQTGGTEPRGPCPTGVVKCPAIVLHVTR